MKRIQFDNFKTEVSDPIDTPGGKLRVLSITDHDSGEMYEFAYPLDAAAKIGAALQGTAVRAVPASALSRLSDHKAPGGGPRLRGA